MRATRERNSYNSKVEKEDPGNEIWSMVRTFRFVQLNVIIVCGHLYISVIYDDFLTDGFIQTILKFFDEAKTGVVLYLAIEKR